MLTTLKGRALSFLSLAKGPADSPRIANENSQDHKFTSTTSSPALTFSTTLTSASTSSPYSFIPLAPHHATEHERSFARLRSSRLRSSMAPPLAAAFELARRSLALVSGRTKAGQEEERGVLYDPDPEVILYPRSALELDRLQMSYGVQSSLPSETITSRQLSFITRRQRSARSQMFPTSTSFESVTHASSARLPPQRPSYFPYNYVNEDEFDADSVVQPSSPSCYSCESAEADAFEEPGRSGGNEDSVKASNALARRLPTSARYYGPRGNEVSFFESDADSEQDADIEQRRPRASSHMKKAVMEWTLTLGRNVSAAGPSLTPAHNAEAEEVSQTTRPVAPRKKGKGHERLTGSSSSFSRHRSKIPFPLKLDTEERADYSRHDWTLSLDLPWNHPLASAGPSSRARGSSGPSRFIPSSPLRPPSYTQPRATPYPYSKSSLGLHHSTREAALVSTFSLSPPASELARESKPTSTRRASMRFSARPGDIISWVLTRAGARFGLRKGDK
jgi:hypothetical protein